MHWQIGIIRFFSTSHVKQNSQGDQNQQGNKVLQYLNGILNSVV